MSGRSPITFCLLLIALTACTAQEEQAAAGSDAPRPNIVFILADDMGLGDIAAYNPDTLVPTPHLTQLAREGARFTDAHSPSAVCTPTRYGILTGRYSWRVLERGVLWGRSPCMLEEEQLTLPEMLQQAGYTTGAIGKWHLGLGADEQTDYEKKLAPGPLEHGFDSFFGIPASLDMQPYCFVRDHAPTAPITRTIEGSQQARHGGGGFWRAGPIAEDFAHDQVQPRLIEEAVSWIGARGAARDAGEESPWFLYLPLASPHTPWLPSAEFRGRSNAGVYGDFASMVDAGVGEVMTALTESGFADDTIVIFTSDNGAHWTPGDISKFGHFANGAVRGQKADIHEGGHRVPMIVRWPGQVPADSIRPELFGLNDWMATFAGLLELELPEQAAEDSFDQSAVFASGVASEVAVGAPARDELVHHSLNGMFALRSGNWKLIEGLGSGGFTAPNRVDPEEGQLPYQLYDLAADSRESVNLADEMPERVDELAARLDEMRRAGRTRPSVADSR